MDIGKILRGLRKERNATLEQVAFDAGTDASNLSRIERGLQRPSPEVLNKIAKALGVTTPDIYVLAAENIANRAPTKRKLPEIGDYSDEAVELRRYYRLLTPENRYLVLEYVKMLRRLQESRSSKLK